LGWNQQETKDVEKKIKNKIHFVDNYLLFDIYIIIMTDISISTDETVEIIYNVSEDTSELDFLTIKKKGENIGKENWDKYNVKNIHKFTWTPPKEGNYTLNVNGEEISIEVNEIPDSVLDNLEADDADPPGPYETDDDLSTFYNGNLTDFNRVTTDAIEGGHSVEIDNASGDNLLVSEPGDGLPRYHEQGDTIRALVRLNSSSILGVAFNASFDSSEDEIDCYAIGLRGSNNWMRLYKFDGSDPSDGGGRTVLDEDSTDIGSSGIKWLEIDTSDGNGNISAELFDTDSNNEKTGGAIASVSGTDSDFNDNRGHGMYAGGDSDQWTAIDDFKIVE